MSKKTRRSKRAATLRKIEDASPNQEPNEFAQIASDARKIVDRVARVTDRRLSRALGVESVSKEIETRTDKLRDDLRKSWG